MDTLKYPWSISVVCIFSIPPTVTDSSQDPAVTQVRLISHTAYTRLTPSTRKKTGGVGGKESELRVKSSKWLDIDILVSIIDI